VLSQAGIAPLIADIPAGVEATIRESKDRRLLFILNTLGEPTAPFAVPPGIALLSDGSRRGARLVLPAYGCCIIELA
jgi:beta-galactosidase